MNRKNMARAALAGLAASIPMAWVMAGLNRWLPRPKKTLRDRLAALPPKQITRKAARRAGASGVVQAGSRWDAATWLAHLSFGAAAASLYPLLSSRRLAFPAALRGATFGLAVWMISYQGWLPAGGFLPPATDLPARRNAVMALSHVLWGALIGLLTQRFETAQHKEYRDFQI